MVESSGLLNRRRALKLYRGFESLPLRQHSSFLNQLLTVAQLDLYVFLYDNRAGDSRAHHLSPP